MCGAPMLGPNHLILLAIVLVVDIRTPPLQWGVPQGNVWHNSEVLLVTLVDSGDITRGTGLWHLCTLLHGCAPEYQFFFCPTKHLDSAKHQKMLLRITDWAKTYHEISSHPQVFWHGYEWAFTTWSANMSETWWSICRVWFSQECCGVCHAWYHLLGTVDAKTKNTERRCVIHVLWKYSSSNAVLLTFASRVSKNSWMPFPKLDLEVINYRIRRSTNTVTKIWQQVLKIM
jgi:hypothetical protein